MSEETKAEETKTEAPKKEATSATVPTTKKKKKWPIITGVIVAVLVIAGAGMWVWHEQPSFCGAICHTPMDGYLATYDAAPNAAATDAYGNEVSNSNAMLAVTHATAGITCLQCHEANLGQQMSEGMNWVSGNYEFPLEERSLEDLTSAVGNDDPDSFCLKSGCHDALGVTDRKSLQEATADLDWNPHVAQHGEIECSECHKAHRASTVYCGQCHSEANKDMPEGWVSYADAQKLLP